LQTIRGGANSACPGLNCTIRRTPRDSLPAPSASLRRILRRPFAARRGLHHDPQASRTPAALSAPSIASLPLSGVTIAECCTGQVTRPHISENGTQGRLDITRKHRGSTLLFGGTVRGIRPTYFLPFRAPAGLMVPLCSPPALGHFRRISDGPASSRSPARARTGTEPVILHEPVASDPAHSDRSSACRSGTSRTEAQARQQTSQSRVCNGAFCQAQVIKPLPDSAS
jgi:hypothetical protein